MNEADEYSYSLHMSGQATTLARDDEEDIVTRLRSVVAEVTGKPVDAPKRVRMGFLP